MKLTWQTGEMVSCMHAAEAWLRSPSNMDAALACALTAPDVNTHTDTPVKVYVGSRAPAFWLSAEE